MSLLTTAARPPHLPESFVPPLENGDRLTRAEFERRYAAMPEHVRAELVEGVVIMASPVRFTLHAQQHTALTTWVGMYLVQTPGVLGGGDATIRLDLDNEPQPDVCVLIDPACGGKARIDEDGYIHGAPEFVAEVAASTVSQDLGPKLNAYRRNGVCEYLVWRVQDAAIDWFILREGRFDRLPPDADGVTRSVVFPGLWLDTAALLASDLLRVHAVLRDGLAAPAHSAFVAKLAGRRDRTEADRMVINPLIGFGEKVYRYDQIAKLVEATHLVAPDGNLAERMRQFVVFDDGEPWCHDGELRHPTLLIELLKSKTGRPFERVRFIEEAAK